MARSAGRARHSRAGGGGARRSDGRARHRLRRASVDRRRQGARIDHSSAGTGMTLTWSATAIRTPLPRSYRKRLCGTKNAATGRVAFTIARQWTATAHGGVFAAIVLACGVVPQMSLLPIGGAVADRVGAHRVMPVTLTVEIAESLGLAAVVAVAGPAVWALFV